VSKCNCSTAVKVLGDGCESCNPELALEYAKQTIDDLTEENLAIAIQAKSLREALQTCNALPGDYYFNVDMVDAALSCRYDECEIIANNRLSILAEVSKMMNDTPMPLWGVGMEKLKGKS
jgi:hypothetical protein